ncbi:sulfotransferase family 2 domain-containing protein [Stagnihabitans tardus]|uniref:Sulfotransferase family 2 domain-containing protein n=1 Tax=Stagnihabitans tardus TaxID=2699202 RepID=A0AAE5BX12_9RHOB|nr:sulfotransferase family 2 domain-containing protein [Stagnihabitans tardus]NBZ89419.1 sulfotransferase family 2 domain-containing protein [Stagnihabitans tardus]
MTAFLNNLGLTYYSTPKVACTSLKFAAFEIENGFSFNAFVANGLRRHIHNFYPTLEFARARERDLNGNTRIAVIRDPIDRFLSAYSNRVVRHDELSEEMLKDSKSRMELCARPSIGQFIEKLEDYRAVSNSIRHHTNSQVHFLGSDPSYYDHLFKLSEIKEIASLFSERAGRQIIIPHQQRGGNVIHRSELSGSQVIRIMRFYDEDYRSFGAFGDFVS